MQNSKRLVETFKQLVQIDSESRNEEKIHKHLVDRFKDLDLDIYEDDSKEETQLGSNNLIVKLRGEVTHATPIFFSAHTDTVSPGIDIEVIEKDGALYSKGQTILGADNKAGIAIMIEAIQRLQENRIPSGLVEFVLSPGEEIGLLGSAALDMTLVEANMGYVLDSAHEVGRVTVGSPHLYMYDVTIKGKAAHSGLEPEKGISAVTVLTQALPHIKIGRIDEQTTANIGMIAGGETTNIVMEELLLKGEVRSISDEKAQALLATMETAFKNAAADIGATAEVSIRKMATGFDITKEQPVMQLLADAITPLNLDLITETSGGGSDANSFNAAGKSTVNLSIGYDHIHTTDETISIDEMEKAVQLVIALIKQAAARSVAE